MSSEKPDLKNSEKIVEEAKISIIEQNTRSSLEISPKLNTITSQEIRILTEIQNKSIYEVESVVSIKKKMKKCANFKPREKKYYKIKVKKITTNDGKKYILKQLISKNNEKFGWCQKIRKEYYIGKLASLLSGNVAKTLDLMENKNSKNELKMQILSKYGGKNVYNLAQYLSKLEIKTIFVQLLLVFIRMSDVGISHLDIKPQNIVYKRNKRISKIIDFGSSIRFNKPNYISLPLKDTDRFQEYTEMYAPPEIIKAVNEKDVEKRRKYLQKLVTEKIDVYSFGSTFTALFLINAGLLTNSEGIPDEKILNLYFKKDIIAEPEYSKNLQKIQYELYRIIDYDFTNLLIGCLNFEPSKRPTFSILKAEFAKISEKDVELSEIFKNELQKEKTVNYLESANFLYQKQLYESAAILYKTHISKVAQIDKFTFSKYIFSMCGSVSYDEIIDIYNELIRTEFLPTTGLENIISESNLGNAFMRMGEYQRSIEHNEIAIKLKEKFDPKNLFNSYINLINAYSELGNYGKAYAYYQIAYQNFEDLKNQISEKLFYWRKALLYRSLAQMRRKFVQIECIKENIKYSDNEIITYRYDRQLLVKCPCENSDDLPKYSILDCEESINLYSKSIKLLENLPENIEDLATTYNNLASVYAEIKQYEKSIEFYQLSLNIRENKYKADEATTLSKMGMLYCLAKKFDEGIKILERDLAITLSNYGDDNKFCVMSLSWYAYAKYQKNLLSDSFKQYAKCDKIIKNYNLDKIEKYQELYKHVTEMLEKLKNY